MIDESISDWQFILDDLSVSKERVFLDKKMDNKARVKVCHSNEFIYNSLLRWLTGHSKFCKSQKNEELSAECRKKGNRFYVNGNLDKSLYYYTRAVLLAPKNSEELNLAFGNRSAVLFDKGQLEECISDIKHATASSDSSFEPREVKLFIRKARALEFLNRNTEARSAYKTAEKIILSQSCQDEKKFEQSKGVIDLGLKRLDQLTDICSEFKTDEFEMMMKDFISGPEFPCASSKVDLVKDYKKGRHVIAKEDIDPGEILFLEKPFAFVVLPAYSHERCQTCCKYIINPLPLSNSLLRIT